MEPRGGGKAISVRDGEFSEARLAKILPPYRAVSAPSSWSADFDDGLPSGWTRGEWVPEAQNVSAAGAVVASAEIGLEPSRPAVGEAKKTFDVRSHELWANGLVRVRADSQLTYRIKMDRPQWYQVFLCVRADPIKDNVWSWNYEYQEANTSWDDIELGAWREVVVPLKNFKSLDYKEPPGHFEPFALRGGEPPPEDGLVVWILFTTQNQDRGMVIDDIAISSAAAEQNHAADVVD
jgi:hypothetical protein